MNWEKTYRALACFLSLHEATEITDMIFNEDSRVTEIEKKIEEYRKEKDVVIIKEGKNYALYNEAGQCIERGFKTQKQVKEYVRNNNFEITEILNKK